MIGIIPSSLFEALTLDLYTVLNTDDWRIGTW